MITTTNEKEFIEILCNLQKNNQKLILGDLHGNQIKASGEIRNLATAGGMQFGLALIDFLNRRGSGRYTDDPEATFIYALDMEREAGSKNWYIVYDSEHTANSIY